MDTNPHMPKNDEPRSPDGDEPRSSPWRQPVIWLVVALVAASVAGGIAMVVIASGDGSTDAVPDPVRRTAQVQTADLGPDEFARTANLSAIVRIDAEQDVVEVFPVSGEFDRAAPLRLELLHPTLADRDVSLQLQPTELGWRIATEVASGHDWNVRLGPADGRWRVQGRLPKGQQAASLRPSLQAR